MQTYPIPLIPGPVSIPEAVRAAYQIDFGSPDSEDEFFDLYAAVERDLQTLLNTRNPIAILSGEGMVALWAGLKSVLRPGDRVVAVANGLFGYGIGDMARQIGADVTVVGGEYDTIPDMDQVIATIKDVRPRLVTAVHCETPSGTLTPLAEIGAACHEAGALFYVDFVASGGGAEVRTDDWHIDLGLLGSQKVLSLMPDLSMVTISERAWAAIAETNYVGYDALAPWRTAVADRYLPYTHNWQAMQGLHVATSQLLAEGMEAVLSRHDQVAAYCRARLTDMGIRLFPASAAICSPTVTAAYLPDGWTWPQLDASLRQQGMAVGGNYGPLAGKVFRIGHMGSQAEMGLVSRGMDVLAGGLGGGD